MSPEFGCQKFLDMKLSYICAIALVLGSCGRRHEVYHRSDFKIDGYRGTFTVNSVNDFRNCSYFECGESSEKILGMWYQFSYQEVGRSRIVFPLIDCTHAKVCVNTPINFKFCENRFIPIESTDQMTIDGKRAEEYSCSPEFIVKI